MNLRSSRPNRRKDDSREYIVTWSVQDGWTALNWAEEEEREDIVKQLISHGAETNHLDQVIIPLSKETIMLTLDKFMVLILNGNSEYM